MTLSLRNDFTPSHTPSYPMEWWGEMAYRDNNYTCPIIASVSTRDTRQIGCISRVNISKRYLRVWYGLGSRILAVLNSAAQLTIWVLRRYWAYPRPDLQVWFGADWRRYWRPLRTAIGSYPEASRSNCYLSVVGYGSAVVSSIPAASAITPRSGPMCTYGVRLFLFS